MRVEPLSSIASTLARILANRRTGGHYCQIYEAEWERIEAAALFLREHLERRAAKSRQCSRWVANAVAQTNALPQNSFFLDKPLTRGSLGRKVLEAFGRPAGSTLRTISVA